MKILEITCTEILHDMIDFDLIDLDCSDTELVGGICSKRLIEAGFDMNGDIIQTQSEERKSYIFKQVL